MYLDDPGRAKLALLREGVETDERIDEGHGETPSCDACRAGERYLDLVLPGGVAVSAPIRVWSPLRLVHRRRRPLLVARGEVAGGQAAGGEETMEIEVLPQPALCRGRARSGLAFASFAILRGEVLALRPLPPVAALDLRDRWPGGARGVRAGIDDVVEAVEAALGEGAPPFIRIEAGFLDPEDAGWTEIEPYVRAIRHHFDVLIHLRWAPPRSNEWIEAAYAAGVDAVSFPLEIADPVAFERAAPGKARLIGHDRYLSAAAFAARVFPAGAVSAPLLVGLEPSASTADGIETLVGEGVVPLLVPLPWAAAAPWETIEDYAPLLHRLFEAARAAGIPFLWTPSQGDLIAPIEGRFRARRAAPLAVAVSRWARSGAGAPVQRTLARIRRRLKVLPEG